MLDSEKAKNEIQLLIEKYHRIVSSGEINNYSEEDTKKDFILPFFEALGWDVYNKNANEVTAEKKISHGRVDYAFRIGEIPKFMLEAKPFKENINDRKYIDQTINYSWLKGVTWAVLTNFKKIKVFNAELKAAAPALTQFIELDVDEYINNFDKIILLAKDSFENDLLNKTAEGWGKKLPRKPIDERLFSDLTQYRELLTKNISLNNKNKMLKDEELDEAVHRLISRLIFIRTLEDRQYEEPLLLPLLRENQNKRADTKLRELSDKLNDVYNARLFAHHLCDDLEIDDAVLKTIIEGLHRSEEQLQDYNFDLIDADILGGIYEQYLSYVLKRLKGKVKLNGTLAHKKEQGIFYTPQFVVKLICKILLELLEEKKVDFKKIRVLDPACGSGSFLIKIFDMLLSKRLLGTFALQPSETFQAGTESEYKEKIDIIENNIYGVDLDPRAVEIVQLSLFLKGVGKKHKLPLLKDKVKSGNSLVDDRGVDFLRAFKWEEEFQSAMAEKGFDVILGNPPYEVLTKSQTNPKLMTFLKEEYRNRYTLNGEKSKLGYWSAEYNPNLFALFLEKSVELLKDGGFLGFIIQNSLFTNKYFKNIRRLILEQCVIKYVIDFRFDVFSEAVVDSAILILEKEKDKEKRDNNKIKVYLNIKKIEDMADSSKLITFDQSMFNDPESDYRFSIYLEPKTNSIIEKLDGIDTKLKQYVLVNRGIGLVSSDDRHKASLFTESKTSDLDKPVYVGKDINRYVTTWSHNWARIEEKTIAGGTRNPTVHEAPEKLIFPRIRNLKYKQRILASYDDKKRWVLDNYNIIRPNDSKTDLKLILGFINSKLLNFYFRNKFIDVNIKGEFIEQIPIKIPNDKKQTELISLVDKMLSLNNKLIELGDKITDEKEKLENEINETDNKLNELIYEIYDISPQEKQIIEESA